MGHGRPALRPYRLETWPILYRYGDFLRNFARARRTFIPVLGIDIGTGGSRAIVMADDGSLIASATAEHQAFTSERAAWAEQDPADWWRACQQAVRSVLSQSGVPPQQIACIGLSGQMHGTMVLDQDGQVLRPSIIWCDQRGEEQCAWLNQTVGARRLLELTCNPALTNFTLIKLLWIREHEPHIWSRVRHVLLPKDYVRFCLSGEYAIDVAEASGTLLLDVVRRCWSQELLGQVDLDAALLPRVFESPEICARVTAEAAATDRTGGRNSDCRGRRRSGGRRSWHGDYSPGNCERDDWNVGSSVRGDRPSRARSQGPPAYVLSCDSGPMARHGRDPGSRSFLALVARFVYRRGRG